MKNLFLLAISLPLLLGGCGEKANVEPVAEVKPELDSVNGEDLEAVSYTHLTLPTNREV